MIHQFDFLQTILQTLIDDKNKFDSGQLVLGEFNDELENRMHEFLARWRNLRQVEAILDEQDFIQTMESSIPRPSV